MLDFVAEILDTNNKKTRSMSDFDLSVADAQQRLSAIHHRFTICARGRLKAPMPMEKPTPCANTISLKIVHPEKERHELCELSCDAGTTLDELITRALQPLDKLTDYVNQQLDVVDKRHQFKGMQVRITARITTAGRWAMGE